MARAGIYKSEVVRARNNLLAMGRYPSRGSAGNHEKFPENRLLF